MIGYLTPGLVRCAWIARDGEVVSTRVWHAEAERRVWLSVGLWAERERIAKR